MVSVGEIFSWANNFDPVYLLVLLSLSTGLQHWAAVLSVFCLPVAACLRQLMWGVIVLYLVVHNVDYSLRTSWIYWSGVEIFRIGLASVVSTRGSAHVLWILRPKLQINHQYLLSKFELSPCLSESCLHCFRSFHHSFLFYGNTIWWYGHFVLIFRFIFAFCASTETCLDALVFKKCYIFLILPSVWNESPVYSGTALEMYKIPTFAGQPYIFVSIIIIIIIIDYICIAPFEGPKAALHGEQTNKQTKGANNKVKIIINSSRSGSRGTVMG